MIKSTMNLHDWSLLLLLSIVWGGSFFFVEIALNSFPPLTLVALRVSLACSVLWGVILVLGLHSPFHLRTWGTFLAIGLINNALPFSFLTFGQLYIASSLAAILNATTPLFTVLVATLFLSDEKLTRMKVLGVMFGFIGVVTIIGVNFIHTDSTFHFATFLAQISCLLAAACYACAGVYGRRLQKYGISPLHAAVGQLTTASLLLWPVALVFESPSGNFQGSGNFHITGQATLAILSLAIASTAFAYVLYFKLLARVGATNLLLVTFLVPVSALLLGVLVLGERLTINDLVGIGFIALGLSAVDGRLWRLIYKANDTSNSIS